MRFITLTGAKQNLGDHLISARCEDLLRHVWPEAELVRRPSWQPLEIDDAVQNATAILIMGGPGLRHDMWPGVYPLAETLDALPAPVIPLGIGWKGERDDDATIAAYRLSENTRALLGRATPRIGLRDVLSVRILEQHGLSGILTGCPAWYDLDRLGQVLRVGPIRRVAFSAPAALRFAHQASTLLRVLARVLPAAEITTTFHHGFEYRGGSGNEAFFAGQRAMRNLFAGAGFESVDLGGALEPIRTYDEFDLHVGYRVHAHLYRLSRRTPSILVHEDGRGAGADATLGLSGVRAFGRRPGRWGRRVLGERAGQNRRAAEHFESLLRDHLDTGFHRLQHACSMIDATFPVMKTFIRGLG